MGCGRCLGKSPPIRLITERAVRNAVTSASGVQSWQSIDCLDFGLSPRMMVFVRDLRTCLEASDVKPKKMDLEVCKSLSLRENALSAMNCNVPQ